MMKYTKRIKKDSKVWTVLRSTSLTQVRITYQHSVDNTEYVIHDLKWLCIALCIAEAPPPSDTM
jgi:hypothetical protein